MGHEMGIVKQDYLALRHGTTEWNARAAVASQILRTLEHGKYYTLEQLGRPFLVMTRKGEVPPKKLQFIVEKF